MTPTVLPYFLSSAPSILDKEPFSLQGLSLTEMSWLRNQKGAWNCRAKIAEVEAGSAESDLEVQKEVILKGEVVTIQTK